jgi:tetratricopeptide (TPR) repeat protein
MKKYYLIISLLFLVKFIYSDSYDRINNYFLNGIIDKVAVENSTKNSKDKFLIEATSETFYQFLEELNVYAYCALLEDDMHDNLRKYNLFVEKNIRKYMSDAKVLNSYINLKWNEMAFGENFSTINNFPFYCRYLSKVESYKSKALLKLAFWYIYATDGVMAKWNTFIINQEKFIEEMNDVEKYNAYIHYAIFYMKIGNHSKAFSLLKKAEKIYPENLMHFILSENFKKGVYGW